MPEIITVRQIPVTIEANGRRSAPMTLDVPTDPVAGNAELVLNFAGARRVIEMPYRSLQSASAVNLVFDRDSGLFSGMQLVEIDDDRSISAAVERGLANQRPRNAVARRDPVSGELRVTYDEPDAVPPIIVNVEPTPVVIENQITLEQQSADAEISFKRDPKSGRLLSAKITETESDG